MKQYLYNWLVLGSKMINTLIGGTPHDTLSMALGRAYVNGTKSELTLFFVYLVNWLFATIFKEANHVQSAYLDKEPKAKSLWEIK